RLVATPGVRSGLGHPVRAADRGHAHRGARVGRTPVGVLAEQDVAPQDVVLAVAVVVAGAVGPPHHVGHAGDRLRIGLHPRLPDGVAAGLDLAPQDVVLAVTLEVADAHDLP